MYVYPHLHQTYMHACIPHVQRTCMHACMHHGWMHTHVYTYMHACIHTYIHACIETYLDTYMHTHMHTDVHTYIHAYIHVHIHVHADRQIDIDKDKPGLGQRGQTQKLCTQPPSRHLRLRDKKKNSTCTVRIEGHQVLVFRKAPPPRAHTHRHTQTHARTSSVFLFVFTLYTSTYAGYVRCNVNMRYTLYIYI